jgi:nucleoside-diphosphate-sugar epimerase
VGAGYVGKELLVRLQGAPCEISITTTRPERFEELKPFGKRVLLLQPDGKDDLEKYIEECDALIVLVAPKNSHTYEETYLNTAKRISASLIGRKQPPYLLYTSSTSVCEGAGDDWVTEMTPLNPTSANAKILLETEQVYLHANANACILRLGGIYGPNREMTDRARRFSGLEMPDNGDRPTNSIHLEDIVSAILFSLKNSLTGVYQLVNDDHRSRRELYDSLCASIGIPGPLWRSVAPQGGDRGYKVSNQKIKDAGFVFKHLLSRS